VAQHAGADNWRISVRWALPVPVVDLVPVPVLVPVPGLAGHSRPESNHRPLPSSTQLKIFFSLLSPFQIWGLG